MNRIPAILLALACWLSAGGVRAALTDPAQIQTEAYVNLVQADQSLDAGRLDEALSQYKAARDYYLQLAKDFPGWEPRVIQYRKTYCDNQIADVERRKSGGVPEELPELPPEPIQPPVEVTPVVAVVPAPERAPAADRSVEIDYLKSRIASLESELADAEALQDEVDALRAQNEKLQGEMDLANQKLGEKAQGEQAALESLQAELQEKESQLQALREQVDSKKELDQVLNDMEGKVNELREQNERLNSEMKTLDRELDEAEARAEQAEQKARQLEDELMKGPEGVAVASNPADDVLPPPADLEEKARAEEKPAAQKPEKKKEPKTAPAASFAESPVKASVPPKPVPDGLTAADYVRQLLQEGDNDAALATVQQARAVAGNDMNLALIEGIALIRLQRYSDAAALLIDLAKNNPKNAEVHATLGAAMMGAGFYSEARETLLMAAKLDKNLPEVHYNLAQLFAFVDPVDLKAARKYYQGALSLGIPPDPQLDKALK